VSRRRPGWRRPQRAGWTGLGLSLILALAPTLAAGQSDPGATAAASGQTAQSSQWLADLIQGCWACGAFNTISSIGLSFADQAFAQLASGMTLLIGLFMALWLLAFAASLLLPFSPEGGAGHWNRGARKLFQLLLVLSFLQASGPFWTYLFIPVISAGMGVASQMATATDGFESQFGGAEPLPNSSPDYCAGGAAPVSANGLSANSSAAAAAMAQMDCPIAKIQSQFAKGLLIGVAVMQQGTCGRVLYFPTLQAVSYFIAGLALILAFLFGTLVFPLLLIDVVVRVALVAATAPLWIAATLFRATARVSARALWSLAQCCLTLMFGATIAGIGKATMAYILVNLTGASGSAMGGGGQGGGLGSWQALTIALENPCSAGLSIGLTSAAFYMLLGTAIILIFMMRRAGSLATELTNVTADGLGAKAGAAFIAGKVASTAGRVAQPLVERGARKAAAVVGTLLK
jgi:hypothetical protein